MKLITALTLLFISFHGFAYEKGSLLKSGFLKSKNSSISKIDERIKEHEEVKSCMSSAADWKTLMNCKKSSYRHKTNRVKNQEKFLKIKKSEMTNLETRISDLQEQKSCLTSAEEWKALHACNKDALDKAEAKVKALKRK